MKFSAINSSVSNQSADCLVLFIRSEENQIQLSSVGQDIDATTEGLLSNLIKREQLSASLGQVDVLFEPYGLKYKQLMLIGLGGAAQLTLPKTRKLLSKVISTLDQRKINHAALSLSDLAHANPEPISNNAQAQLAQFVCEAAHASQYRYTETKSKQSSDEEKTSANALKNITFILEDAANIGSIERSIAIGAAIGAGTDLTKKLSNLPGNVCTPTYLAKTAQTLGKKYGITTTVLDEAKMKKLGMGSLLSVSKGSREPAKLISMEYKGGDKNQAPIVLVGKGLTFDAGGISLKPGAAMDEMKYDMCGGASVLGVMNALGELKLPINVVGVVASSENMPDGAANKPGDVVTSMKGLTIEILNTDAEGRLILCDALTYVEKFKPAVVIDIATLTGACMVALGQQATGLFSNDDSLADALLTAGNTSGDRAWRLPIWDEYQPQLKSNFADMANIGGRFAGAVTAACFLSRFTEDYKWAHLDVAGTAWVSGANKGATGRPVGLLMQYIIDSLETA